MRAAKDFEAGVEFVDGRVCLTATTHLRWQPRPAALEESAATLFCTRPPSSKVPWFLSMFFINLWVERSILVCVFRWAVAVEKNAGVNLHCSAGETEDEKLFNSWGGGFVWLQG